MSSNNWRKVKLGDVCNIRRGSSPRPIIDYLSDMGMPWVKIADATANNSRFINITNEFIKMEGVAKSVVVEPGSLILSNSGTAGIPKFMGIKACIHDGWQVFDNLDGIDKDYLYYVLLFIRERLLHGAYDSTMKNLTLDMVRDAIISLPPIKEQKLISRYLNCLDNKIELNICIKKNLEEMSQVVFKRWFIDFEPFQDEDFEDSELGMIPKGWRVVKVGDINVKISDYVANGSFASLKQNVTLYEENNYAYFIRNVDLKANVFEKFVDEHSYNFLSKTKLFGNEVIISNVGDVGSVFLCPVLDKPMTLGNNIIMITSENKVYYNYFMYMLFKYSYGQDLIKSITGGSAQPKFNKTDFRSLKIILPTDDVIVQFNGLVEKLFEQKNKKNSEITNLAKIRDSLLPKLMSSEIRVPLEEVQ